MRFLNTLIAFGLVIGLSACASSVLPKSESRSQSPWTNFAEAKKAYDLVEPEQTTKEDLSKIGFDPVGVPNMTILNYVDIVGQFGSTFQKEDLPDGIQQCIAAKQGCTAYHANIVDIKDQRVGNVPADLLGFKQKTHRTGWAFKATIVMINDKVVYKLWSGTPSIESFENKSSPLGPMQNMSDAVAMPF